MDDLIIRVLNGEATPFEVERLRRWRMETWENNAYYEEVALVWALTAPETQPSASSPPSVQAVLEAAISRASEGSEAARIAPAPSPELGPGSRGKPDSRNVRERVARRPWVFGGLLAASLAAVALGIHLVGVPGPEILAEYAVPAGETRTVTLDDGSFVRLAAGSRLRVWKGVETREVSLDGRAFFAVTRDASRPFIVTVGTGEVRVLGTRFEVSEERGEVRTIVVEGLVTVSNEIGSVEVAAGGLARMDDGQAPALEEGEDVWGLLEWPDGLLIYQGTPLSQVAEEVSRHFGRPLVVAAPDLANRRITAWFQREPFGEVAEAICMVVDASCSQEGEGVTLRPRDGEGEVR